MPKNKRIENNWGTPQEVWQKRKHSTRVVNFLPMATQTATLNQYTDSLSCSNKANNLNAGYSFSSPNPLLQPQHPQRLLSRVRRRAVGSAAPWAWRLPSLHKLPAPSRGPGQRRLLSGVFPGRRKPPSVPTRDPTALGTHPHGACGRPSFIHSPHTEGSTPWAGGGSTSETAPTLAKLRGGGRHPLLSIRGSEKHPPQTAVPKIHPGSGGKEPATLCPARSRCLGNSGACYLPWTQALGSAK